MNLVISAFGRSGRPSQKCKVVSMTLRSQHDSVSVDLEAIVVPFICEEMVEAPKDNMLLQHLIAEGKPLVDAIAFPGVEYEQGVSLLVG